MSSVPMSFPSLPAGSWPWARWGARQPRRRSIAQSSRRPLFLHRPPLANG